MSVLSIVHAGGGGAILTNEDLMRALAPRDRCYILACGPDKWVFSLVDEGAITRLEEVKFDSNWRGGAPMSTDRAAAFADLAKRWRFDIAHVRSLLGSGPEIITAAREAGCRVIVSFHDFGAICPTVHLLDADNVHCAGVCTAGEADCTAPQKWFSDISKLKHAYVHEWRSRVSRALPGAEAFVTTSAGAADLLQRHFPALSGKIRIIEHGRDLRRRVVAAPPRADRPVRVVVLGVIGVAKGRDLIEALVRLNAERGQRFEFHVLGALVPEIGTVPGVVQHGRYERAQLLDHLATIAPSFSLVPSIGAETFSHTVTESWAAGIPLLASNLGAPAERITRLGGGWLVDPREPEAWLACLRTVSANPALWAEKAAEIGRIRLRSTRAMAADYRALYRSVCKGTGVVA